MPASAPESLLRPKHGPIVPGGQRQCRRDRSPTSDRNTLGLPASDAVGARERGAQDDARGRTGRCDTTQRNSRGDRCGGTPPARREARARQAAGNQQDERSRSARQDRRCVWKTGKASRRDTAEETEPDQTDCCPHPETMEAAFADCVAHSILRTPSHSFDSPIGTHEQGGCQHIQDRKRWSRVRRAAQECREYRRELHDQGKVPLPTDALARSGLSDGRPDHTRAFRRRGASRARIGSSRVSRAASRRTSETARA
jgi:hypothetical protein